jgi:F0F1-type ATP synthase membrane subunit b/b'
MITFNTNLLETNVINLTFVIGVLATLGKDAFFEILEKRQAKIISSINEIEDKFKEAQKKLQTAEDRLDLAEQEATQIKENLQKDLKAINFIDFQKEEDQNKRLELDFQETFENEKGKLVREIKDRILYSGLSKAEELLVQKFQSKESYVNQINLETNLFRFFDFADSCSESNISINTFTSAFDSQYPDETALSKTKKEIHKYFSLKLQTNADSESDKVMLKTSFCQRLDGTASTATVTRNLFKSDVFAEPSYFNTSGQLIVDADAFRLSFKCPAKEKSLQNPSPTNVIYYFSFMWFACYGNQNKLMAYKRISDDGINPSTALSPPTFTPKGEGWKAWTVSVAA